jgi:hypothetical protein
MAEELGGTTWWVDELAIGSRVRVERIGFGWARLTG